MKTLTFIKNLFKKHQEVIDTILIATISAIVIFACLTMSAYAQDQNYIRKSNTFIMNSNNSVRDTLVTDYTMVDTKGVERTIIINKANGHCYVMRKSAKSGKIYRQYLKASLSESIAKELGIAYKPSEKKQ